MKLNFFLFVFFAFRFATSIVDLRFAYYRKKNIVIGSYWLLRPLKDAVFFTVVGGKKYQVNSVGCRVCLS
jgi:hypothetical protein